MVELRRLGVVFEEYDLLDLKTVNGMAEFFGNYASYGGKGERGAWFRDSEGNLLATWATYSVVVKTWPKLKSWVCLDKFHFQHIILY